MKTYAPPWMITVRGWTLLRLTRVTTVFVSHNVDEAVFLGDRVIVLSARPAKVVADVEVPFGAERSLSLLSSERFFELRNRVLAAFEKGKQA